MPTDNDYVESDLNAINNGNYQKAIQYYDKAIELATENALYFHHRGFLKLKLGRYEDAIADYDKAIELDPKDAVYFHNRGSLKSKLGRHEEAITDYNKAIELAPENSLYFNNRGFSKLNLGRDEEAIADYNKAIELAPENAVYFHNRGSLKSKLGRHEEAIADYDKAIELDPKDVLYFNNRGSLRLTLGRHEEAIADYNKAIELAPENSLYFHHRGFLKLKLGRYEDAIADYDKAIELDPENSLYFNNRGFSKLKLGRDEEAIADYNKAIELYPKDAVYFNNHGSLKSKLGRHEEAIADYDKAIELAPENSLYFHNRGFSKLKLGRDKEAIADYNKAIELDPENVAHVTDLGIAKARLGRTEDAIKDYKEAVRLDEKSTTETEKNIDTLHDEIIKQIESDEKQTEKTRNVNTIKLIYAIKKKDFYSVENAVKGGAYLNQEYDGFNALQHAAIVGDISIIEYILKKRGIEKHPIKEGNTLLHLAAKHNHKALVKWLMKNGYNANAKNDTGYTVEKVAEEAGHTELADYIRWEAGLIQSAWKNYIKPALTFTSGMAVGAMKGTVKQTVTGCWRRIRPNAVATAGAAVGRAQRYWRRIRPNAIPRGVGTVAAVGSAVVGIVAVVGFMLTGSKSQEKAKRDKKLKSGLVDAAYTSLDTHPLKDLYEEIWSEPRATEGAASVVSLEILPALDSKAQTKDLSNKEQGTQEKPQPKSNTISSFNQSLSTNDYLGVVVPYLAHYSRKYSPFTLPWNREKVLSEQDRRELDVALKKRKHLETNFLSQQKSRAANYEFLSDKISFVEKELCNLKSDIDGLLERGKESQSQLAEVQSRLEKLEEMTKQLSVNNKKLRQFEARERQLAKRGQKTGRQASTVLHYNVTENRLTQEVVYDHPPLLLPAESVPLKTKRETVSTGLYPFSQSQQFWGRAAPSSPALAMQDPQAEVRPPVATVPRATVR